MKIIDGRKLSREILAEIKTEIAKLPFVPVFCDVLVGDDPASVQYVEMKAKAAERLGMKFHSAKFKDTISEESLVEEIKKLEFVPDISGIIIQLPLPAKFINKKIILDAVPEKLDVDCLGTAASDKFYKGENAIGFPTALACMHILDSLNLDLTNKNIVVLGKGDLVGKPVAALLRFRNLNPIIISSKTENQKMLIRQADVIISGIGHSKYLTGDMLKEGVVLIDAGTSESNGGIVGDVDLESVKSVASFVSPVPGGVGPVTVAMLLKNVLKVTKSKTSPQPLSL
jgi:methylenetetrahydrofolate dehydrogenase (NADP+)/methenyltetrahydrofolate cyclohydrolase